MCCGGSHICSSVRRYGVTDVNVNVTDQITWMNINGLYHLFEIIVSALGLHSNDNIYLP